MQVQDTPVEQGIIHDLGDGLVLRKARAEDGERLADFHANTLLDIGQVGPDERLYAWMRDLMSGEHSTLGVAEFTIVEEMATGMIVSSIGMFSQTCTYECISFPFAQPEILSIVQAYWHRGLVRA